MIHKRIEKGVEKKPTRMLFRYYGKFVGKHPRIFLRLFFGIIYISLMRRYYFAIKRANYSTLTILMSL